MDTLARKPNQHSFDAVEEKAIRALEARGFRGHEARLAVACARYCLARDLFNFVRSMKLFPGLDDKTVLQEAMHLLKNRGWLGEHDSSTDLVIAPREDLAEKIGEMIGDPEVTEYLKARALYYIPNVDIEGSMFSSAQWTKYLEKLEAAKEELCLPMLATEPDKNVTAILKNRADQGVTVKILLGSYSVVQIYRNRSDEKLNYNDFITRVKAWRAVAATSPNMEVRLSYVPEDMLMSTCMLMDKRQLRLDIYDPLRQPSKTGTMVHIDGDVELPFPWDTKILNVVSIFQIGFDKAWSLARPLGFWGTLRFAVKHIGELLIVGMALWPLSANVTDYPVLSAIGASICAALIFRWFEKKKYASVRQLVTGWIAARRSPPVEPPPSGTS